MKYCCNSIRGTRRSKNQDRYLVLSRGNVDVFLIFDGVSSNINSDLFIEKYIKIVKNEVESNPNFMDTFEIFLYDTNLALLKEEIDGYSTVCILAISNALEGRIKYLSIGDSRIYSFTDSYLEQITNDDNLGERRNILTKFLGSNQLERDDFVFREIKAGGEFLLCTDGFYTLMEDNLKRYFSILNFKLIRNIKTAILKEQLTLNKDDSTYIIIKNEI